jgi:hypothetical protein
MAHSLLRMLSTCASVDHPKASFKLKMEYIWRMATTASNESKEMLQDANRGNLMLMQVLVFESAPHLEPLPSFKVVPWEAGPLCAVFDKCAVQSRILGMNPVGRPGTLSTYKD